MIVLLCPAANKPVPLRAEKTEGVGLRTKQVFLAVLLLPLEYACTVIKLFFACRKLSLYRISLISV